MLQIRFFMLHRHIWFSASLWSRYWADGSGRVHAQTTLSDPGLALLSRDFRMCRSWITVLYLTRIVDNNGFTVVTVPFAPSSSCWTRSFSVVRLALLGRIKAPNTFVNLSHYLIISSHYLSWTSIQLGIPPQIVRMVRSGVNWPDNPAASPRITSHSGRRFAGIH